MLLHKNNPHICEDYYFVIAKGFEPLTVCLEGRCSIQLSYATLLIMSGWQDSNLRPPRPKRGAITGLRYTPRWRRDRDSNPGDVYTSTD